VFEEIFQLSIDLFRTALVRRWIVPGVIDLPLGQPVWGIRRKLHLELFRDERLHRYDMVERLWVYLVEAPRNMMRGINSDILERFDCTYGFSGRLRLHTHGGCIDQIPESVTGNVLRKNASARVPRADEQNLGARLVTLCTIPGHLRPFRELDEI
jgi:hypothetical protein